MALVFYDTLHRKKILFESIQPGVAKLYTCGPTVYDVAHIGNFRTYMFEDLLRRTLEYAGYNVIQVMNLTDVDDKTIRASQEAKISLAEHTQPFIDSFFEDLDTLGISRAEFYPRATEHVPEMIHLVKTLVDKGFAYEAEDGIYFSIEKYAAYGQLSGMKLDQLTRGIRVSNDEYEKEDVRDFALWKKWTPADGEVFWDSPFGKGRPGWHIECSAMSMKYLGEEFDLHTGGVDNLFPHHENELAQSRCGTESNFVRYWMHSAHLIVNGEKMSKSLGNFFTLRDLLKKGYSPRIIRYLLIGTHYRQQINFSGEIAQAAQASLERLDTLYNLARDAHGEGPVRSEILVAIDETEARFRTALSDDLNIAGALAALYDCVSGVHRLTSHDPANLAEGNILLGFWERVDQVLGILIPKREELPVWVRDQVWARLQARAEKNWQLSDEIRDQLDAEGYHLEDQRAQTTIIWSEGREIINYLSIQT